MTPEEGPKGHPIKTGNYDVKGVTHFVENGVLQSKVFPDGTMASYEDGKLDYILHPTTGTKEIYLKNGKLGRREFSDGSVEGFDWDGSSLGRYKMEGEKRIDLDWEGKPVTPVDVPPSPAPNQLSPEKEEGRTKIDLSTFETQNPVKETSSIEDTLSPEEVVFRERIGKSFVEFCKKGGELRAIEFAKQIENDYPGIGETLYTVYRSGGSLSLDLTNESESSPQRSWRMGKYVLPFPSKPEKFENAISGMFEMEGETINPGSIGECLPAVYKFNKDNRWELEQKGKLSSIKKVEDMPPAEPIPLKPTPAAVEKSNAEPVPEKWTEQKEQELRQVQEQILELEFALSNIDHELASSRGSVEHFTGEKRPDIVEMLEAKIDLLESNPIKYWIEVRDRTKNSLNFVLSPDDPRSEETKKEAAIHLQEILKQFQRIINALETLNPKI